MARRPALASIENYATERTVNALTPEDDQIESHRQARDYEESLDLEDRSGEAAFERLLRERA